MDIERRHPQPDEIRAGIVQIALTHHLVSKYTSLVAVDKTPARPLNATLNSEQVPNILPYGQSMNAIYGFPVGATKAPVLRLVGIACLLAALFFLALQHSSGRRAHAPCR